MDANPGIRQLGLARNPLKRKVRLNSAYLFIAPSMVIIAVFIVWPIIQAFWMSLHDWSFIAVERPFVGLANYIALVHDSRFWNSFRVTAVYTGISMPSQIILALLLALALNSRLRAARFLQAIYFFPVISSLAVMAIVWKFLLDPDIGLITHWFTQVGLPPINWLQSTTWALPSVIFVGLWKNIGFNMVILLAGLQAIPEIFYEAAAIDGASRWARFWNITLPGLRQTLLFVTIISVIGCLQMFDQVYVMTGGGPLFRTETLVTYMYHQGFDLFRMGYASSIAGVLFLIIMILSYFQLKFFKYQDVD